MADEKTKVEMTTVSVRIPKVRRFELQGEAAARQMTTKAHIASLLLKK